MSCDNLPSCPFETPDVRRPVHSEHEYRVVTKLVDDSSCWYILPGRAYVRVSGRMLRVPEMAKYVVLSRTGEFMRWVCRFEEWEAGF